MLRIHKGYIKPLLSTSLTQASTTNGLLVLYSLTSVVRSTPNTAIKTNNLLITDFSTWLADVGESLSRSGWSSVKSWLQTIMVSTKYFIIWEHASVINSLSQFSLWVIMLNCWLYSLPADVLRGLFVTHSFLPPKWMHDKQTPQDICGKARNLIYTQTVASVS